MRSTHRHPSPPPWIGSVWPGVCCLCCVGGAACSERAARSGAAAKTPRRLRFPAAAAPPPPGRLQQPPLPYGSRRRAVCPCIAAPHRTVHCTLAAPPLGRLVATVQSAALYARLIGAGACSSQQNKAWARASARFFSPSVAVLCKATRARKFRGTVAAHVLSSVLKRPVLSRPSCSDSVQSCRAPPPTPRTKTTIIAIATECASRKLQPANMRPNSRDKWHQPVRARRDANSRGTRHVPSYYSTALLRAPLAARLGPQHHNRYQLLSTAINCYLEPWRGERLPGTQQRVAIARCSNRIESPLRGVNGKQWSASRVCARVFLPSSIPHYLSIPASLVRYEIMLTVRALQTPCPSPT